jgi:hypothetical protein
MPARARHHENVACDLRLDRGKTHKVIGRPARGLVTLINFFTRPSVANTELIT